MAANEQVTARVETYSVGICHASACAPSEMSREEVEGAVNAMHPTGIGPWLANEPTFATGDPNPCECNTDVERRHWLLTC